MQIVNSSETKSRQGFTLIELSIVLVIIGLIVGGVLVGQDLIKAAQIRATVSQFEKYNTAVNTFRSKYNGIPGDLLNPANFFSGTSNSAGTAGLADGDGLVGASAGATTKFDGETAAFWYELNQANFLPEAVGSGNFTADVNLVGASPPVIPLAKLGRGNSIEIRTVNGLNYWEIGTFSGKTVTTPALAAGLSPIDAFDIDTKIDDGVPNTGTIRTIATAFSTPDTYTPVGHGTGSLMSGDCVDTTLNIYANASQAASAAVGCTLGIRTNF